MNKNSSGAVYSDEKLKKRKGAVPPLPNPVEERKAKQRDEAVRTLRGMTIRGSKGK